MRRYKTAKTIHRFFCTHCGREGVPLARSLGHGYKPLHLKYLWCPWCKKYYNHVECCNDKDVFQFLYNFQRGVYHGNSFYLSRNTKRR